GTVTTGNTLSPIGRDPESGFKPLHNSDISCKWTPIPAPDPVSHKRIKTNANYPRKCRPNYKSVPLMQHSSSPCQQVKPCKIIHYCNHCDQNNNHKDGMYHNAFNFPCLQRFVGQMSKWISSCFGKAPTATYPGTVPSFP